MLHLGHRLERFFRHHTRLQRVKGRIKILEDRLKTTEDGLKILETGWHQHLPGFLSAVAEVSALAHELDDGRQDAHAAYIRFGHEITRLWERLDSMRSEVLYGVKCANEANGSPEWHSNRLSPISRAPKILNQVKLAEARLNGIKLNLSSGRQLLDGYINVDQCQVTTADIVADVRCLPFEPGSVLELFSRHLIDNFPRWELRDRILPYWKSLLRQGGIFRAVVQDGETIVNELKAGRCQPEDFCEVFFSVQQDDGDLRCNLFTPASLCDLLEELGFNHVEVPVKGRRNGKSFDFEIIAIRP